MLNDVKITQFIQQVNLPVFLLSQIKMSCVKVEKSVDSI